MQLCNRSAKYIVKKDLPPLFISGEECVFLAGSRRGKEVNKPGHGDIQQYNKYSCFCYVVGESMASRPWSG